MQWRCSSLCLSIRLLHETCAAAGSRNQLYGYPTCFLPDEILYLREIHVHSGGLLVASICTPHLFMLCSRCLHLSVILSFCERDYWNPLISLKLAAVFGPNNRKNFSVFGGEPIPNPDSGSLFHFPQHCRMGDFRRFISISHIQSLPDFYETWQNDWPRRSNESVTFLSASLYVSKRGACWDRLCRDVVGRCLVGRWSLVVTRVHCGQTVHPRPIVTMEH